MKTFKCEECEEKCILITEDDEADGPTTCPWKDYQRMNEIEETKAEWK